MKVGAISQAMHVEKTLSPVGAAVFTDGRFGQTPTSQGYVEFECNEQFPEEMWSECTVSPPSCVNCKGDAIKCFSKCHCSCVYKAFVLRQAFNVFRSTFICL